MRVKMLMSWMKWLQFQKNKWPGASSDDIISNRMILADC
jgi:hypothetical protein